MRSRAMVLALALMITGLVARPAFATALSSPPSPGSLDVRPRAMLTASDGAAYDYFGHSIAASGGTVVVGATGDDLGGSQSGSAYVFVRTSSAWTQQATLVASDGSTANSFGWSVAVDGDTAVVGAIFGDSPAVPDTGSAYVYVRSGTTWTQQAKLVAPDGATDDYFGRSVAIDGDTAVIGADESDTPAGVQAGSAYLFVRSGIAWTLQAKLLAFDGGADEFFGKSVGLSGEAAVVGGANQAAYVLVRSGTTWTEQAKLTPPDWPPGGAGFGLSVTVNGDTAVVGAMFDSTRERDAGSAYVFVRSGTIWTPQAKLTAPVGVRYAFFGTSVAVEADRAIVGAQEDTAPVAIGAGSAYVFVRSGTTWSLQAKLTAPDGETYDEFGFSVGMSGGIAVVGARFDST
jgi:hypothetical protein